MIPGQSTRSRMLQLKILHKAMKIPHKATKIPRATTKTQHSQVLRLEISASPSLSALCVPPPPFQGVPCPLKTPCKY